MIAARPLDWARDGQAWPLRQCSRFVAAGGIEWHVQAFGEEAAPPVLLLHGTGAATHSWRDLAPLLARKFQVIAPDLPGHGFTRGRPAGGTTMPAMARAVAELLARLEVAPALIVGHSAGAAIAARMVLDGQTAPQGIVGLNAAVMPMPGLAAALFPTLAKLLFVNPLAPRLFAQMAQIPGETARFLARSTGSAIDLAGIAAYEMLFRNAAHCGGALAMMAHWDLDHLRRDWPRLALPVLLLHGENDAAIAPGAARQAAALLPQGQVEILPRFGHLMHEEAPHQIAATINAFAERILP